jgi:lipoprotein-anchoring transpeptidase ErfK/SrfK
VKALRATTRQIVVNRKHQALLLYHRRGLGDFEQVKHYTVSTGVAGLETPAGRYSIHSKSRHPDYQYPNSSWVPPELRGKTFPFGDPNNPIVGRWIGLGNGSEIQYIGIHGSRDTADLGRVASHGCIRMSAPNVIDLFDRVVMRTTVFIV